MKTKIAAGLLCAVLLVTTSCSTMIMPCSTTATASKDDFVPDEETAIKIAVAVWEPIYGAEDIASEKPYRARLTNGVWIVEGSLPKGSIGGVAEAEIARTDGRILNVIHGQ